MGIEPRKSSRLQTVATTLRHDGLKILHTLIIIDNLLFAVSTLRRKTPPELFSLRMPGIL